MIRKSNKVRLMNVIKFIGGVMFCLLVAVTIACAILLFTGCTAVDEAQGTPAATGSAIVFSARADSTVRGAATRTAQGTITVDGTGSTVSLQEQGFGVFACHTGVHPYVSTSTTTNLFYNQLVSYSAGQWTYDPEVYWPSSSAGVPEYVTFFAYGPHSSNANGCIADMSRKEDVGDPWILYQLGGTTQADGPDGWKTKQVDLLYDFRKDQQRSAAINTKVNFEFKHALACIGDRIQVSCHESVTNRLKGVYTTSTVKLTVSRITIDYLLTRKGRLVLNNATEPNWQAVESEDSKVHRTLVFNPNLVMAQATSSTESETTDFDSGTGHGIFYIPVESGSDKQQLQVTADYAVTSGDPTEELEAGSVTATVDLSFVHNANQGRNLNITLKVPEPECSGTSLENATVGMIICQHGRAHAATTGSLSCGGEKVAVVACTGGSGESAPYNHGLAIALSDAENATAQTWCNQTVETCLTGQATNVSMAISSLGGLTETALMAANTNHVHYAATVAYGYRYAAGVRSGAHPVGTSRWFMPTVGQWNMMLKGMTGSSDDVSSVANSTYEAASFNTRILAAGGTGVIGNRYWAATESSADHAWYVNFNDGKTNSTTKSTANQVRSVLAF